ncbi:MAG: FAD-dependent oxidoreductase [Thermodesulfobacteriota bacterium]
MEKAKETEVLIVGAGITGLSIARELSKYYTDVTVIEKESDVSMGISKTAGSLVYMGLFQAMSLIIKDLGRGANLEEETRTERMRMLWEGYSIFNMIAHDLDILHKHVGVLVIARNESELEKLKQIERLSAFIPGAEVNWVDKEKLFEMEPNLTPDAIAGLYDLGGTISTFGPEYVIAVYENAVENGIQVLLDTECLQINEGNGVQFILTNKGPIKARFVINCAGKYADKVADMAKARTGWNYAFYRSQALLLDKKLEGIINNIIGIPPDPGKIDFLYPLEEGNIHVYCGYYDLIEDRDFIDTTRDNFKDAIARMKKLVPKLSEDDIITSYVGVRVFNDKFYDDNLIESSPRNENFINVIIRMPGFTPASTVAQKVLGMLVDRGLGLKKKENFKPTRRGIPRFRLLNDKQRTELIKQDPRYGHVVCRCETVTEGEIVEAIKRGAKTVQGVQFRTRAGMGRCQRGFCGPRVVDILSRELGIPRTDVTYKGKESRILLFQSKELLNS